jgi:hypothetical protein
MLKFSYKIVLCLIKLLMWGYLWITYLDGLKTSHNSLRERYCTNGNYI